MEIVQAGLLKHIQKEYDNSGGYLSLTIREFKEYFKLEEPIAKKLLEELISTGYYQIITVFDFSLGKECERLQIHPRFLQNYWLHAVLIPSEAKALLELGSLLENPFNSRIKNLEIKDQHLVRLTLIGHDISSLPPSIDAFKYLEVLELQRCQLTSLSDSIGSLLNLKVLDLDYNQLTSLPKNLGNLKNLQELWCRHNKLFTLPETLGNLENLQELSLERNRLVSLPDSLGLLKNLQVLSLKNNALTSLPTSLRDLPNLKVLEITGNRLTSSPIQIISKKGKKKRRKESSLSCGENEYLLKICAIGSVPDLKSQFIRRFAGNKFDRNDLPTLGVDISTRKITIDDNQVKLILVDTAGQEFFGKLRPSYYRGATAATILFDKSDRQSFENVPNWLKEFQKYIRPPIPIALVGLITQSEEVSEEISREEGQALATHLNMVYFESKPTNGQQALEIFTFLARQVIEKDV